LPTVLTKEETVKVIERLPGTQRFMAKLLYGSGLRLMECLRLRVKDPSSRHGWDDSRRDVPKDYGLGAPGRRMAMSVFKK
jgi:integrase